MIEIKDLLSRWASLLSTGEASMTVLREILSEVLKTEIKSEDIKVKNGVLILNIKPIYKSQILIKREEILEKIGNALGKKAPIDIR